MNLLNDKKAFVLPIVLAAIAAGVFLALRPAELSQFSSPVGIPDSTLQAFLVSKAPVPAAGNKTFCEFDRLGAEKISDKQVKDYVWVYCQEFSFIGGKLDLGTGSSFPAVMTESLSGSEWKVTDYTEAQDGGLQTEYNKQLFPPYIRDKAQLHEGKITSEDPDVQAKRYFGVQ